MIYTHIPYAPKAKQFNIGWAYNNFIKKLELDDWACFIDHDAMFRTIDWYQQLETIIKKYPETGCFAAMTNRLGNPNQVVDYKCNLEGLSKEEQKTRHRAYLSMHHHNHDILYHRKIGAELQRKHALSVVSMDKSNLLSGVLLLVSKKVWQRIKFKDGFFGVDNDFHLQCLENGIKVYLMKGVYVYHWYRGNQNDDHVFQIMKYQREVRGENNS